MPKTTLRTWAAVALLPIAAEPASASLDEQLKACPGPYALKLKQVPFDRLFSTLAELGGKGCSVRFDVAPELANTPVSIGLEGVKMATVLDVLAGEHDLEYVLTDDGRVRVRPTPRTAETKITIRACPDSPAEGCAEIGGQPYRFSRRSRIPLPNGGLLIVDARRHGEASR